MNDYSSWGQEYLDEAERIKRRLLVIRAERDYDIAGEQAQRVQMLYTMYLECLVTGHALQKASARLSHALQYSALGMRAEQSRDR